MEKPKTPGSARKRRRVTALLDSPHYTTLEKLAQQRGKPVSQVATNELTKVLNTYEESNEASDDQQT